MLAADFKRPGIALHMQPFSVMCIYIYIIYIMHRESAAKLGCAQESGLHWEKAKRPLAAWMVLDPRGQLALVKSRNEWR